MHSSLSRLRERAGVRALAIEKPRFSANAGRCQGPGCSQVPGTGVPSAGQSRI